jgi:hypothetical protein
MKSISAFVCLVAILTIWASVTAQQKSPTEAQCREMVSGMVQSMKAAPLKNDRDRQSAKSLIERVEKVIQDNRSRGTSECETPGQRSQRPIR